MIKGGPLLVMLLHIYISHMDLIESIVIFLACVLTLILAILFLVPRFRLCFFLLGGASTTTALQDDAARVPVSMSRD